MTSSGEPESLAARQGRLLRRIQALAAEQHRLTAAGPEMFADSGGIDPPQQVWQQRLDHLEKERIEAEHDALLAGVDRGWIDDARELGARATTAPDRAVTRQHPDRATGAQEFYLGMLEIDLWHLERMAGLDAARTDRIATGRWSFDDPPEAQHQFYANMFRYHQRVTVLAAAAQITRHEGELLWGASVEGIRRAHTAAIGHLDETALATAWNSYATADPMLRVPPYVPTEATSTPSASTLAVPPTPRQMLLAANAALRSEFVAASLASAEPVEPTGNGVTITTAVDAALREGHELAWDSDTDVPPQREAGIEVNRTPEL
ncbi:hypothetical protein ACFU44_06030 [Nocardia rhizosphaerihabitans]|uniref:hypothetical protein n=1 Tax=Nocardia rhizosphaerihabitans TaxID=1691570 RepID=UPI00366D108D